MKAYQIFILFDQILLLFSNDRVQFSSKIRNLCTQLVCTQEMNNLTNESKQSEFANLLLVLTHFFLNSSYKTNIFEALYSFLNCSKTHFYYNILIDTFLANCWNSRKWSCLYEIQTITHNIDRNSYGLQIAGQNFSLCFIRTINCNFNSIQLIIRFNDNNKAA